MKKLTLPLNESVLKELKAGDLISLSGVVYTARDCAHKKIFRILDENGELPFELNGACIYYAGPCPAKDGMACGSCGPTTSARMQSFIPRLFSLGLKAIIGKGEIDEKAVEAIGSRGGAYFVAIGGAGALYGSKIKSCELVAFPELLSEAVYKLEIEDFPLIVAVDGNGNNVFKR